MPSKLKIWNICFSKKSYKNNILLYFTEQVYVKCQIPRLTMDYNPHAPRRWRVKFCKSTSRWFHSFLLASSPGWNPIPIEKKNEWALSQFSYAKIKLKFICSEDTRFCDFPLRTFIVKRTQEIIPYKYSYVISKLGIIWKP